LGIRNAEFGIRNAEFGINEGFLTELKISVKKERTDDCALKFCNEAQPSVYYFKLTFTKGKRFP